MPATFDSFGVKFLYPDNWVVATRDEDESDYGMTLDLPGGGFFSVDTDDGEFTDDELIDRVAATIRAEYDELESEAVVLEGALPGEKTIDFRFFVLDLLVVSRVVLIHLGDQRLLVQFQAENRDFDTNELVLTAILQQIRGQI